MTKVYYVLQFRSYYQPIWEDVDNNEYRLSDAKRVLESYVEEDRQLTEFKRREFRIIQRTIIDEEI